MFAIAEQDDHFTKLARTLQPMQTPENRITDIGLRLIGQSAWLFLFQDRQKGIVTERQWAGTFRTRSKGHQADEIIGPTGKIFAS